MDGQSYGDAINAGRRNMREAVIDRAHYCTHMERAVKTWRRGACTFEDAICGAALALSEDLESSRGMCERLLANKEADDAED